MADSSITLDIQDNIGTLTLNRPDKRNAFNQLMTQEFLDCLQKVEQNNNIRVLIITGAGKVFCSGADLNEVFLKAIDDRKQGNEPFDIAQWTKDACLKLYNLPIPTIASLNGPAIGLGLTITLACDLRVACEEATLAIPFTRFNIMPEFGSSYLLPRIIGIAKACEIAYTGRQVTAQEASSMGLVNTVVAASNLPKTTRDLAESICHGAPLGLKMTKLALHQGLNNDLGTQLEYEYSALNNAFQTKDHEEGVRAFLEKRRPQFRGS